MITMTGCIMTPVVGGREGDLYHDVLYMTPTKDSGGFLVEDAGETKLIDIDRPIKSIIVMYDTFIRGMHVTYRVAGNGFDTVTFERGKLTIMQGRADLNDNEVLLAVSGRAGPVSRIDPRQVIHNITFILYDTAKGKFREQGPFGNTRNNAIGEHFYVTNVVGFGGFQNEDSDSIGLSGLFFLKDMNKM